MKVSDAIRHFKTETTDGKRGLADALGIRVQSIYDWGPLVPFHWQPILEKETKGALKAMSARQYAAARKARREAA